MKVTLVLESAADVRSARALLNALDPALDKDGKVDQLGLLVRHANALKSAGIYTVEQLLALSSQAIRRIPNIGPGAIKEIQEALADHGLQLQA